MYANVQRICWFVLLLLSKSKRCLFNRYHDLSYLVLTCLCANILHRSRKLKQIEKFSNIFIGIGKFMWFVSAFVVILSPTPLRSTYERRIFTQWMRARRRKILEEETTDCFCRCQNPLEYVGNHKGWQINSIWQHKAKTKKMLSTDFSMFEKKAFGNFFFFLLCLQYGFTGVVWFYFQFLHGLGCCLVWCLGNFARNFHLQIATFFSSTQFFFLPLPRVCNIHGFSYLWCGRNCWTFLYIYYNSRRVFIIILL